MTGSDSVDYIGEIYYATPYKAIGFERTAIKKSKKEERWYYEAFLKTSADSNNVKNRFLNLYDAVKWTMKDNTGNDFILASSAKEAMYLIRIQKWICLCVIKHDNHRSFTRIGHKSQRRRQLGNICKRYPHL